MSRGNALLVTASALVAAGCSYHLNWNLAAMFFSFLGGYGAMIWTYLWIEMR
jgi:hypothetical protein